MTYKPISTISYNSVPFLEHVLNQMFSNHLISEWYFIHHIGEGGSKDHNHIYINPNKKLDPMDLSKLLTEIDPDNPIPLGCMPWRSSVLSHWLMYAIHDEVYLLNHNSQSDDGKIPYSFDDIHCSHPDQLEREIIRARNISLNNNGKVLQAITSGADICSLCVTENISPTTALSMLRLYQYRLKSPRIDPDTGELV